MEKQKFIEKVASYVQKYASDYGICVHSPIIAQAILESGWGDAGREKTSFKKFSPSPAIDQYSAFPTVLG